MNRITTNDEIKALLGLGAASNILVDMWNDVATERLAQILGLSEFGLHTVTEERTKPTNYNELVLNEFPVNVSNSIVMKTIYDRAVIGGGYTFKKDPGEVRRIYAYDSGGNVQYGIPYDEIYITYDAGYSLYDTITVVTNTGLNDKVLNVKYAGVVTAYTMKTSGATGNQINIGATINETATNIATKLGGTSDGAVVTLPLGYSIDSGSAFPTNFTYTNSNLPKVFKNMVALIVGGAMAEKDNAAGIASYSIGGKSVTFRSDAEKNVFAGMINSWIGNYKKVMIIGL